MTETPSTGSRMRGGLPRPSQTALAGDRAFADGQITVGQYLALLQSMANRPSTQDSQARDEKLRRLGRANRLLIVGGIVLVAVLAVTYVVVGLVVLSARSNEPIGWVSIATGGAFGVVAAVRVYRRGLPLPYRRRDDEH